jgi:hypothetical protein
MPVLTSHPATSLTRRRVSSLIVQHIAVSLQTSLTVKPILKDTEENSIGKRALVR